jgi:hypothetical protein
MVVVIVVVMVVVFVVLVEVVLVVVVVEVVVVVLVVEGTFKEQVFTNQLAFTKYSPATQNSLTHTLVGNINVGYIRRWTHCVEIQTERCRIERAATRSEPDSAVGLAIACIRDH